MMREYRSYLMWDDLRPRQNEKQWHDIIWFKGLVPKHSFTMWVANYDRLITKTSLVD